MKTKTLTQKQQLVEDCFKAGIKTTDGDTIATLKQKLADHALATSKEAKATKSVKKKGKSNPKALKIIEAVDALATTCKAVEVKPFLRNSRIVRVREDDNHSMNNQEFATLSNVGKAIRSLNPNVPTKATFLIHPSGSVALYGSIA